MDQNMITIVTEIQVSEERLKEIFEVSKTKQLFDQFMAKEQTLEEVKDLKEKLQCIFESVECTDEQEEEVNDIMITKIKVAILAQAVQLIVDGKSLNQAIQITIKEQMKQASIFEEINQSLNAMIPELVLMGIIGSIM